MEIELRRVYGQIIEVKIYKDLQSDVLMFQKNIQKAITESQILRLCLYPILSHIVQQSTVVLLQVSVKHVSNLKEKLQLQKDAVTGNVPL